jgi:uncharacterized protein (DUF362 family)
MKRRTFIKDITVGSMMLHLPGDLLAQGSAAPQLASITGEDPARITKEAVSVLGGMTKFVAKGDKVLIKPNIGWDRTPNLAACTNPDVVRAIVEMCFEAGAKEVKVLDNPCNPARRTYIRSGISKAAKDAGAEVPYPNDHKLKKVPLNGEHLKEWEVYSDFLETDKIINVPIAKHHSLSRVTLGMKNWLGALGGNRNQLHQGLDYAMVDLAAYFKPVLTVLDAYRVLFRNGPQGGRLSDVKETKTVVAGVDYVAVDALGATFLDVVPSELPFLKIAQERGLGEFNLENLTIEKRTL